MNLFGDLFNNVGSAGMAPSLNPNSYGMQRALSQKELAERQRGAFSPLELDRMNHSLQGIPPLTCIHPNCLICEKHAEIVAKQNQKENEEKAKLAKEKKKDYDKKVKEWLKIIRRQYES